MNLAAPYATHAPDREEIDSLQGMTVLEFGTNWCSHCQNAQPLIADAFSRHPGIPHLKIEDGPGRPLGRSFRVKLWPTLIFLRDGTEVARAVRPVNIAQLDDAFSTLR